jgi:sugar/nucleoside kinase (ribokinase family)
MSLLVVGSVAFDTIEMPSLLRQQQPGGSALYFSAAASYFCAVRLMAAVGDDWPAENTAQLEQLGVDTRGLERIEGQQTFAWRGRYAEDLEQRETVDLQLNVLEQYQPRLPACYRDSRLVFLANGLPRIQLAVLDQVDSPELVIADTVDDWIRSEREDLMRVLARIDGLMINQSEAVLLTGQQDLPAAGRALLELGPRLVVIKCGERGSLAISRDEVYSQPAYPLAQLLDPTGAGDSFAGGMLGYLSQQPQLSEASWRQALAVGTVMASFCLEGFSIDRLASIDAGEIETRLADLPRVSDD